MAIRYERQSTQQAHGGQVSSLGQVQRVPETERHAMRMCYHPEEMSQLLPPPPKGCDASPPPGGAPVAP